MSDYPLLFRHLLNRSKAVHFAYHVDEQRVTFVSEAYAQVLGGDAGRVNEDLPAWLARVHHDDRALLRQRLDDVVQGELVQDLEIRVGQPDGRTQWLCFSACPEPQPDGSLYLSGTVLDVTRSKEVSLNAQKFNTKKDATLEILSHDLAAPLLQLQQFTEHIKWEMGTHASDSLLELLGLMERTCTHGVNLIRDFVDNEFLESANVELKWERTDLRDVLRIIMEDYQASERHTHLHFACALPPEPVYVKLDINKFQQVINNLISNAIKFTPDGGHIDVCLEQREEQAIVTIVDSGVGIPQSLQASLFDKFTKARRPGLRGEKTTGLGMSVIHTIVQLHHGRIHFESQEGQGTCFTIELPAVP